MTEDLKGPNLEEPGTEQAPEMITPAVDPAAPEPASGDDSAALVAAPPLGLHRPRRYTFRFAMAYTGLGIVLAAAITGLIVLVVKPGHIGPAAWSTWSGPARATNAKMTSEIADHISRAYKLNAKGAQLVAVVAGPPQVTSGTKNVKIGAIAVRRAPQTNAGIQVSVSDKTWTYQLCGLGAACSIQGQASEVRGRLVRREALEIALYTFKFAPGIDSVVAFMPPPAGQSSAPLLYLQRSNLKEQISKPLKKTLPHVKPPLPSDADAIETKTIDDLTLPALYTYGFQPLQAGSVFLVLDPLQT